MGSSTTYGSGDWSIGLPVAAINAYAIQIPASLLDGSGGTGWYNALMNGAVALNTISSQILANLPPSFGGSAAGGHEQARHPVPLSEQAAGQTGTDVSRH